jgi:hypothetical protein
LLTFKVQLDVPDDVRPDLDDAGVMQVVMTEVSDALVERGLIKSAPAVSHVRGTRGRKRGYQVVSLPVEREDEATPAITEGEYIG